MNTEIFAEALRKFPRRLENTRIVSHLFIDAGIWLGIALLNSELIFRIPSVIGSAVLFSLFTFRSFGLMHDCVHSSGHQNTRINRWIGEFYGIICFLPFGSWRRLHLDHHRWTGNVEKDPSMKILTNFRQNGGRVGRLVRQSWRLWIPILGFMQHLVFWKATVSRKEYAFMVGASIYLVALLLLLGPLTVLTGFGLYLALVEAINFPHHLGLVQFTGQASFVPREQDRFVRSSTYPKFIAHFVLLNFNLHTEHHAFPAHPWYQLGKIHQYLKSQDDALNFEGAFDWILSNRKRPIESIFADTFKVDDKVSAA